MREGVPSEAFEKILSEGRKNMRMERVSSEKGTMRFEHLLCFPSEVNEKTPLILLFHEYTGMDEELHAKAGSLVDEGFLVGVADLYGAEHRNLSQEKARELLKPLRKNRFLLRERALWSAEALGGVARRVPEEILLLGFSLGGGAVLEMVRYRSWGGAVSVYGYLDSPAGEIESPEETPLLVLHGMKDRIVPPEDLRVFLEEMGRRQWNAEVVLYSGGGHGFCNPRVEPDPARGNEYDLVHHVRAWRRMSEFFRSLRASRK